MAPTSSHDSALPTTNAEIAAQLDDVADSITNAAAHESEQVIRRAAQRLRAIDDPTPLIPRVLAELRHIAAFSADLDMRRRLKALLGEAA
jgi:hypothetical protein